MISKRQYHVFGRMIFECLCLNSSILIVFLLFRPGVFTASESASLLPLLLIFNLTWLLLVLWKSESLFQTSFDLRSHSNRIVIDTFLFLGLVSTAVVFFKIEYFQRTTFLLPVFLFGFCKFAFMKEFYAIMNRLRTIKMKNYKVLLVGGGEGGKQVVDFATENHYLGYDLIGLLNDRPPEWVKGKADCIGTVDDLDHVLEDQVVDEIFISLPAQSKRKIRQVVKSADLHGVRVNIIPESPSLYGHTYESYELNHQPIFKLRQTPLDNFTNYFIKKIFDFIFAATVLLILSPVLVAIALLILLDGKGPVFYKPIRKGEGGKTFKCYKFRTMSICDDPLHGTKSTVKDDPRITKIGRFLRKWDIDELPQFINVLKGEMSVIGPRPHRVNLHNDFRKIVDDYMVRHYVKPGISGWAQVNGWRGPTKSQRQKRERIKHDLWYIENWNFWLDIKIIYLTVFGKKTRQNAF